MRIMQPANTGDATSHRRFLELVPQTGGIMRDEKLAKDHSEFHRALEVRDLNASVDGGHDGID